ncbi:aldo/keto reductase [Halostagnicola larsenii XH-48]|uniref:Aldo/keto reductase n=1 Tax=Halostagnicola larsenii XH-48 TaxID=797299 RepID=W0JN00_9EURY|nr:aldo/keto reductase [Halostagnicola larsenii]AHF99968.1 aldo/keto reductase [Halostagnicola larsenii XH-48]
MEQRRLGSTDLSVTEVGLGTWNIGSDWGEVSSEEARTAVRTALEEGVDFLDTADVYGDGASEQYIADVLSEWDGSEDVTVATKVGRRIDPHEAAGYTAETLEEHVDRSRENLGVDTLDLVQLHCPPPAAYYQPRVFDAMESLVEAGKIDHVGVSVEKVEEALKAIEYPCVETIQIIFNPARQRPADLFLEEAKRRDIGVIVRVPLASGLLTGALSADTEFDESDHRNFNREGEAFDRGETFSGLPFERGLEFAGRIDEHVPDGMTTAQFSLRWILDHDAVSTVIPGSSSPEHIRENVEASSFDPLSKQTHGAVRDSYEQVVYDDVHHQW